MIIPQDTAPMLWSPRTAPGHQGDEMRDRALDELENEDQWVNDFIERLNYAIEDIGREKSSEVTSAKTDSLNSG
jgi:hypothetical protein